MSDPALSPEQEDQVRHLLASARHDEPMPADVAQRLDRVLDQLGAGVDPAPVVDLAARRHRRRQAGQVLLAAAAVVAIGFGVAHISTHGSSGGTSADSSTVANRQASGAGGSKQDLATAPSSAASGQTSYGTGGDGLRALAPVPLRAGHFAADVRAAVATAKAQGVGAATAAGSPSSPTSTAPVAGTATCPGADYGSGTLIPVVYDGAAGVLAVRSEQQGRLEVQVLACGSAEVLRSASVSAR